MNLEGYLKQMRVIIDKSLLEHETIYCGGGSKDKILELRMRDVIRLNNAIVGEISNESFR